jgi:hypothetical protein
MSENRVGADRIYGLMREEVARGWRRLHNEELHNLYAPSNIRTNKLRRMKWTGHAAVIAEMRNAYKIVVRKPESKRPLGRPRHRWILDLILGK